MWGTYYSIMQLEILKKKEIYESIKTSKSVSSSNQSN